MDSQADNLRLAEELRALNEASHGSDLHRAVALAKEGTYWQTLTLGLDWVDPVPLEGHNLPGSALAELTARHGVEPTPQEQARIDALDELDEPLRTVLARFVVAFLALDTAARIAYTEADLEALEHHDVGLDDPGAFTSMAATVSPGAILQDAGVDLTLVFPTRNQFLDAILDLNDAIANHGIVTVSSCAPIQVPPVFSIDITNCDGHYTQDFALLLDAGGDDVYHNNAGGSSLARGPCTIPSLGKHAPAALVDLGGGNDAYGDPLAPRACGVNGGAFLGVGFLLDAAGDDRYTASQAGTNGGGNNGVGFLLDAGGNDTYTAGWAGTNGGGFTGVGFLLDAGGNDTYTADDLGTNGGAGGISGVGILLDLGGTDSYHDPEVPGGSCWDCTQIPKGIAGAQIDSDDPPL